MVDDDSDAVFIYTPWIALAINANGHMTCQFFVDDGLILVTGKLAADVLEED